MSVAGAYLALAQIATAAARIRAAGRIGRANHKALVLMFEILRAWSGLQQCDFFCDGAFVVLAWFELNPVTVPQGVEGCVVQVGVAEEEIDAVVFGCDKPPALIEEDDVSEEEIFIWGGYGGSFLGAFGFVVAWDDFEVGL